MLEGAVTALNISDGPILKWRHHVISNRLVSLYLDRIALLHAVLDINSFQRIVIPPMPRPRRRDLLAALVPTRPVHRRQLPWEAQHSPQGSVRLPFGLKPQ
jgi:hypothetical protein